MMEEDRNKLLTAVRERYWCFYGIAQHPGKRYEGYGDGYMDGFKEAVVMLLTGIDRLDLLKSEEQK